MNEDIQIRKIGNLTIRINRSVCIGSANCVKVAPEVFELDEKNLCTFVNEPEAIDEERLLEACDVCPVDALEAKDESGTLLVPKKATLS
ncbi:MAG TPA: ferredoxin [Fimbriimonadales bacterium]|nr:ferredoxin [Fimbriimonadales bacterium]